MSDDEKTRLKVKAVRRRPATPVAEQATRPVKAVRRKPRPPPSLGLLPPEALTAKRYRFLETSDPWTLFRGLTTDRYEVQLGDRTPLLYTPQRFSLTPGWKFEVRDVEGALRFWIELERHKVLMHRMTVRTTDGAEVAHVEQRFSMFEVKFDVLDAGGKTLFTVYQPAEQHTKYELRSGEVCVARFAKDRGPGPQPQRRGEKFEDAFRVDLESSLLDERDRVIIIATAIFIDRIFDTGEDQ